MQRVQILQPFEYEGQRYEVGQVWRMPCMVADMLSLAGAVKPMGLTLPFPAGLTPQIENEEAYKDHDANDTQA